MILILKLLIANLLANVTSICAATCTLQLSHSHCFLDMELCKAQLLIATYTDRLAMVAR